MAFWSGDRERRWRRNEENEWRRREDDRDYGWGATGWDFGNDEDRRYRRGYPGQSSDYGDDRRYRRRSGYGRSRGYDQGWSNGSDEMYDAPPSRRSNRNDYGTSYGGYGQSGSYDEERYRRAYSGHQSDYRNDRRHSGSDYNRERDYGRPSTRYSEFWTTPGPHAGRGPQGYQRSDERIKEDIHERLTRHGQVDAHEIQIEVQNCEVTLRGAVDSRQAKRIAEDIANSVSGVRDVHNQLRVRQEEEGRQLQPNGSQRQRSRG